MSLFGQIIPNEFDYLSVEHGLSQTSVYDIYQDSDGFMWFGTQDGLNKYDGYDFTVYSRVNDLEHTISNNFVNKIFEDSKGQLWIGTFNGLNRYDKHLDKFQRYLPDDNHLSLAAGSILDLFEYENELWVVAHEGISIVDLKTNQVTQTDLLQGNHGGIGSVIMSAQIISDANVLIGTDNGLYDYNLGNSELVKIEGVPGNVRAIIKDNKGTVWVGTESGLYKSSVFNEKFNRVHINPAGATNCRTVFEDSKGRIWVGFDQGGLALLDSQSDNFVKLSTDPKLEKGLNNNRIFSFFEDNNGNIWIGSFEKGLNVYRDSKHKFHNSKIEGRKGNSSIGIRALYDDGENLWVGTGGEGVVKKNKITGVKSYFSNSDETRNYVRAIVGDKDDKTVWIASGPEIVRIDKKLNKKIYRFDEGNSQFIKGEAPQFMFHDSAGTLWVGTTKGGIAKYDNKLDKFVRLNTVNSGLTGFVVGISEDESGNLWISSYGAGLTKYSKASGKFEHYDVDIEGAGPSDSRTAGSYYDQLNDILWFGTYGGGLNRFDIASGEFKYYDKSDGLANTVVYGVLADDHGNLWMSSNNGISKFIVTEEQFINYSVHDGLQGSEFNTGALHKNADGFLYFGGTNGYNYFHPDSLVLDASSPVVVLTDFKINNESVLTHLDSTAQAPLSMHLNYTDKVELGPSDYLFSIEFAGIHYNNPSKHIYQYKLDGFDKDWIKTNSDNRTASYHNLPAGDYTFMVKASKGDSHWSQARELKVSIVPPIWYRPWFIGLIFFVVTGYVAFNYYRRRREQKKVRATLRHRIAERTSEVLKQNKLIENQNVQLRTAADRLEKLNGKKDLIFSILSHDLRSPLTTLQGFLNILEVLYESGDKKLLIEHTQKINNSLGHSINLLDNILFWSLSQTGSIEYSPKKVDLNSIIEKSIDLYHLGAEKKGVDLRSEVVEPIFVDGDENMLFLIVRNLLSNALKFTQKGGLVLVSTVHDNDSVKILVEDSGIGMSKENISKIFDPDDTHIRVGTANEKGTGLGLALCKSFIEMHNGYIAIDSELGNGTTITICLKVKKPHEQRVLSSHV